MAPIKADLHAVTSLLFTFTTSKMRLRICSNFLLQDQFSFNYEKFLQKSRLLMSKMFKCRKQAKVTISQARCDLSWVEHSHHSSKAAYLCRRSPSTCSAAEVRVVARTYSSQLREGRAATLTSAAEHVDGIKIQLTFLYYLDESRDESADKTILLSEMNSRHAR